MDNTGRSQSRSEPAGELGEAARRQLKGHDHKTNSTKTPKPLAIAAAALLAAWLAAWLAGRLGRGGSARLPGAHGFFGDAVADGEEFEYIVVGAGAAGSAAAARLALTGASVLLLEAGGDPGLISKIPGATIGLTKSSIDWHYETESNNKSCLANDGNMCPFIRGRCVGGTTCLNFMLYTRGNRLDYDLDVPGWTWDDIRPYFLRSEGLYDLHRLPESSARHHGTSGVIPIGYFGNPSNPWHTRLIEGLVALDIPYNPDVNAASQIGVSRVLGFTVGGQRVNVGETYLKQNRVKDTLKLVKNTKCTGIIIDDDNVARGVTVIRGNEKLRFYTKREVVLSAGVVGTPQLLMLSGLGPREHLESLGIVVKADLPVGQEMSDHVLSLVYIQVDDEYKSLSAFSAAGSKGLQLAQWFVAGSGPMVSIGLTDITSFFNTKCYDYTLRRLIDYGPGCELPSVQLLQGFSDKGLGKFGLSVLKNIISQRDELLEEIFSSNYERSIIIMSPLVLHTESRGSVRLASADPLAPPTITPNYLDDKRDVEEMVRALKFIEQLVETPAYKRHNASIIRFRFPECPTVEGDGYWACYARHMTHSGHHAVGTAALGRVVDERLRVRDVKNLRVADASVLPRAPSGSTAAAAIAIGERLSDLLLEDRGL